MKKILNAKQVKKLDEIKNTYPDIKLIDHNEFVRLWHPDIVPISNESRFYKDISKKILQFFSEFHYAFQPLPNSYKVKILTDRHFDDFMRDIENFAKNVDKKQTKDPEKLFSFSMYYNFFTIGIEGLISTMPDEFKHHIQEQIRPILLLMQSISNFTTKSNSKYKAPFVHAPEILQSQHIIDILK